MEGENMVPFPPGTPIQILLAEDNPADARLVREGLRDAKIHNELHTVKDGLEALAFVRKQGVYADAPTPNLVLLDLNMPKKDGRQVLDEMKNDPSLRWIPVVILTSSQWEEDVLLAYERHANCYIRKPVNFDQFHHVVRQIENFWFSIVELPRR
jgi:two-component system, chemotaxis family, response regulator Rcp1